MKCLKCNHTIPDDSVFCEFCGSKVDAQNTYEESSVKKYIAENAVMSCQIIQCFAEDVVKN